MASAWGTGIAALAAIATAVIAAYVLLASQADSRQRSRPMVGALLVRDPHPSGRTAELVVRNYGQSVAYNVSVTFDPAIENKGTTSGNNSFVPMLLARYAKPIPNMMSTVELRNMWFLSGEYVKEDNGDGQGEVSRLLNDEPIPDVVTATIRYSDAPRFWGKKTYRYVETIILDVDTFRGDVTSTHTDDHLGSHKRSTLALEEVTPALVNAAKDLGRIENYLRPSDVRQRETAETVARGRQMAEDITAFEKSDEFARLFPTIDEDPDRHRCVHLDGEVGAVSVRQPRLLGALLVDSHGRSGWASW